MGAITRMAVRSNLAMEPPKSVRKGWRPMGLASATVEKSIRGTTAPVASSAVAPMALAMTAIM